MAVSGPRRLHYRMERIMLMKKVTKALTPMEVLECSGVFRELPQLVQATAIYGGPSFRQAQVH